MKAFIYVMASGSGVLYVGVTSNLQRRVEEHRAGSIEGFSKKYKCHKLVYFEGGTDIVSAIEREKEIKGWRRMKKARLIASMNPGWIDLYKDVFA
jgi:putative endonuclease